MMRQTRTRTVKSPPARDAQDGKEPARGAGRSRARPGPGRSRARPRSRTVKSPPARDALPLPVVMCARQGKWSQRTGSQCLSGQAGTRGDRRSTRDHGGEQAGGEKEAPASLTSLASQAEELVQGEAKKSMLEGAEANSMKPGCAKEFGDGYIQGESLLVPATYVQSEVGRNQSRRQRAVWTNVHQPVTDDLEIFYYRV
jgi:hypothetical protein